MAENVIIAQPGQSVGVTAGQQVVIPLGNAQMLRVMAHSLTAAWGTAVLAVRWSNYEYGPWAEFPDGNVRVGPPTSGSAAASDLLDVRGMGYAAIEVTTAESGETLNVVAMGTRVND